MTFKAGFNKFNTYICLLYIVNELGTAIVIVCVHETRQIEYNPALMHMIECIKKELYGFIGYRSSETSSI